jgi:hypothetical protein
MQTEPKERKTTARGEWIERRANELLATGWKSHKLATQRATKEYRAQSPQRAAANRRNAALEAARRERL